MRDRRFAAATALAGLVLLGLPAGMLGVAWPSMRASLDAPLAGLGALVAAMTVAQFVASGASGLLRHRFGTVAVLLGSVVVAAAGLLAFALAIGWYATIVASLLLGAGVGLLDAAVNTEAALRAGVRFMGGLHAAWAVGASLGPPLVVGALLASGSWRPAYVGASLAFAALAGAIYLTRSGLSEAPETVVETTSDRGLWRSIAVACALMFAYVGIELGAGQWSYTRLVADGALTDTAAGFVVFLYWSSLAAGRVALGLFGHRIAPSRLFDGSVYATLLATLSFWLLPPSAAIVALPLIGATLSVFVPVLMYLIPRRLGTTAAPHVIGYLVAAGMIGGAALPAAVGVAMQAFGVSALGPSLVAMSVALTALHVASSRWHRVPAASHV